MDTQTKQHAVWIRLPEQEWEDLKKTLLEKGYGNIGHLALTLLKEKAGLSPAEVDTPKTSN